MDTVRLGRTGLEVSVAGLGCGGHSRLGQSRGANEAESIRVVHRALDLGITYIDTARAYGTEEIVGKAVEGRRDQVALSSKALPRTGGGPLTASGLRESIGKSLRRLRTDVIDVFHLHGVTLADHEHCLAELVPELERLRDEGALRFIAVSEQFGADPGHQFLQRAVEDGCWDVMMVGFNLLNPSARTQVLPATIAADIGVEVMFAVRRALSDHDELVSVARRLVEEGHVPAGELDMEDPLGFLTHPDGPASVVEAAYRFVRHEPGCHVVLTGTGNVEHLEHNVRAINAPPLPEGDQERLRALFGHLDHLSGN